MRWFILGLIALYIIWLVTGGPARYENKDKPYLKQPKEQRIPEATSSFR
jgi:hypothetical protein